MALGNEFGRKFLSNLRVRIRQPFNKRVGEIGGGDVFLTQSFLRTPRRLSCIGGKTARAFKERPCMGLTATLQGARRRGCMEEH